MDQTDHHVFGSYDEVVQASAVVDRLTEAGFAAGDITVLLKENPESRDFAALKGTKVPDGIAYGPKADLPLDGSYGLSNPISGPERGALETALCGMGVPLNWPHGVLQGRALVSVECADEAGASNAERILQPTEAKDMGRSQGKQPKASFETEGHSAVRAVT